MNDIKANLQLAAAKRKRPLRVIYAKVTEELHEKLTLSANAYGISLSEFMRVALETAFAELNEAGHE